MGREAKCAAVVNGRRAHGRALLETDALLFRGEERVTIPYADMSSVEAEQGRLTVVHPGGTAAFDLGQEAERWAHRILHPPSVIDKMGVKPGHRVAALRVPDDSFIVDLESRGALVSRRARRDSDVILFGAGRRGDLRRIARLRAYLKPDGALWVIRPKGGGAITEADVLAAGKDAGLVDVKVVRFSTTHTAEKFVIPVAARSTR
jgi:hypothetical protein